MSHREQYIWQRSVELCVICYQLTKDFPQSELYSLRSKEEGRRKTEEGDRCY